MDTSERTSSARFLALRALWLLLPGAVAPLAADTLRQWSGLSSTAVEVLLWTGWSATLIALLAPRPAGLTVARMAAPSGALITAAMALESTWPRAVPAIAATALAASLTLSAESGERFVNGAVYGGERRFLLRNHWVIGRVLAPGAVIVTVGGIFAGPLLLAGGKRTAGAIVLVGGMSMAALLARSLHSLSRRWLVAVPGGLVVHDPMALRNAVLLPTAAIESIHGEVVGEPAGGLDLRLGSSPHTVAITLREPVPFPVVRRNPLGVDVMPAHVVLISVAMTDALFSELKRRGLPLATRGDVRTATRDAPDDF